MFAEFLVDRHPDDGALAPSQRRTIAFDGGLLRVFDHGFTKRMDTNLRITLGLP